MILIAEFLISDATIHHIRIRQSYNKALNKGSIVFKLNNVTITVIFSPRRYTKLSIIKNKVSNCTLHNTHFGLFEYLKETSINN
jgi:hypothetical protein